MRIFVLNAGRCGSTTFYRACCHIENYSVSHTSRHTLMGDDRVDYPDHHIEIGNRLVWFLGRLDEKFGDNAFYVHLQREPAAVAKSYEGRLKRNRNSGIISAYAAQIARQKDWATREDVYTICEDYVRTVTENVNLFLKDKTNKMEFWVEEFERDLPVFWERGAAQGDYEKALAEFKVQHNATGAELEPAPHKKRGWLW